MDIHVKKCGGKKQTNMRISIAYLGCGGYQGFFCGRYGYALLTSGGCLDFGDSK